jgi:PE family
MGYVIGAPEMIAAAATDVATIGSTLSAAHKAAAAPTVTLVPAAADEVSASVAHLFSQHAADYQALAGQATAFHEQFVQHLTASAGSYASAEAANASLLQTLTASAGSFTSTVAALQGLILDFLNSANAALGQLLNSLTGFSNSPNTMLSNTLLILLTQILLPGAVLPLIIMAPSPIFPGLSGI